MTEQTDPLIDAIEAAIWAGYSDAEPSATGLVLANPRTVAATAAAVARNAAPAVPAGQAPATDRVDVGTEFVRQTDHPDQAALDAVEADLAAAPVCQFTQGCYRVVPCDPGCATGEDLLQQATASTDRAALMRAHVALAEQAGRDQAALARVRELHDRLAEETDLHGPEDLLTRGSAARRIATALDGWTAPAVVSAVPGQTDTPAVFRAAADHLARHAPDAVTDSGELQASGWHAAEQHLRDAAGRADSETTDETLPPVIEYRVEALVADTWTTLGAPLDLDIALRIRADYLKGWPEAQVRILRCTRTAVVIDAEQPAAGAQQPKEG